MTALHVIRDEDAPPYDAGQADAESATQKYGYVRAYREVIKDCGAAPAMLYGIIEDMIQLGSRTGLGCTMSHAALADQLGASPRAVRTYLKTLRDKGWILWEETSRGGANRYYLPEKRARTARPNGDQPPAKSADPPGNNCRPPLQNLPTPPAKSADNLTVSSKQELSNHSGLTPYALFALICDEAGLDMGEYSQEDRKKEMAFTKRMIAAGESAADVRDLIRWQRSQSWRTAPITARSVARDLGSWKAQGRPRPEQTPVKKLNPNSAAWSRATGKPVV